MAKTVTNEQMRQQQSFILKLKEENQRFAVENGRQRLALTETYGCQQNENDTERRKLVISYNNEKKKLDGLKKTYTSLTNALAKNLQNSK